MASRLELWMTKNKYLKPRNLQDPIQKDIFLHKLKINEEAIQKILEKSKISFLNFHLPIANMWAE